MNSVIQPQILVDHVMLRARSWLTEDTLIIDTETTGLTGTDQVIELAVINGLGHILMDVRVKPTVVINHYAEQVHGISAESLRNMPLWPQYHTQFSRLIENKRLIAFNSPFDTRLLEQTADAHGLPLRVEAGGCAMQLSVDRFGSTNSYGTISLSNATRAAGVSFQGKAHSALGDALTTLALIRQIGGL